jgi:hypothetical protein
MGSWHIALGMLNMKNSVLAVSHVYAFDGRVFMREKILPPPITISEEADISDIQTIAQALRPAFDYVWREYNYPSSLHYNQSGEWVGQR